ncbi:MAG: tetratricopeptide repeat protein [Kofleriaceae bacterium]|nr:tetratricopeptide repeat protein [Kofleriaceae bacterium]
MFGRLLLAAALCGTTFSLAERNAHAESLEKIAKKLIGIDAEIGNLSSGIRRPKQIGKVETQDLASRRLIDAQVNFGVGNYDDAAVMLYDFVEKHPTHRSWDEALYYLAESLFQKGDYVASRSYFIRLASERGNRSKFYQQALERLIELTLKLDDSKDVDKWLTALDGVPQQQLRDSVPYVRGKYAHFREQFDESLKHFGMVPKTSEYYSQAQYFMGVNYVAKGELGLALDLFKKLVLVGGESKEALRVAELSHMVLGRLYYERDQPSKAVDEYLRISRRSDLFDEALFEVTWVYVKNKEFDKALRALELLALADPNSQRMPDVRILEGNLRIRKAQRIAIDGKGNSKEEYDRAIEVFDETRNNFRESHEELKEIIAEHGDASTFLQQITGRSSDTFDVTSTIPEVAAAWLREQPEVARVVDIETNLGQIEAEIAEAEATIVRLEAAIDTPSRVNIFPSLAQKRIRSTEILDETVKLRVDLATQARNLADKYASGTQSGQLDNLRAQVFQIQKEISALPDGDSSEGEKITKARNRYTKLSERAAEVSTIIDVTEAQLVALEKYVIDQGSALKVDEIETFNNDLKTLRAVVDELRGELKSIRSDTVLAKDRAGTGDEAASKRNALRADLQRALDAEHGAMMSTSSAMSSSDRGKMQQIGRLTTQAKNAASKLSRVKGTIDSIVDEALGEVRDALSEEKAHLGAYRREFLNYERESHEIGGEILVLSFQNVSAKFYDILVRSDVGIVDVAWSLKEAAETSLKRLTLDQARERRTLDSDFADVIREIRETRAQELFDQAAGK